MGVRHLLVLLVVGSKGTDACIDYVCSVLGIQANPCDCSKYINCGNQGPDYIDCPAGTLFNPAISACSGLCDFDCGIAGVKPAACPTDPPVTQAPVVKVCKKNKRCNKRKGTCMARNEVCSTGIIVARGCKGKSCKCCAPSRPLRCPTYKRCGRSGGKCQDITKPCAGQMIAHKCTRKRCGCCIKN